MSLSLIALQRMIERLPGGGRGIEKAFWGAARPALSSVRRMADQGIVKKLHSLGVDVDPPRLEGWSRRFPSAQSVMEWLIPEGDFRWGGVEVDWVWMCLTVLWERWLPDRPSLEMLDDQISEGYDLLAKGGAVAACDVWIGAWRHMLQIMEAFRVETLGDFDETFRGSYCLFDGVEALTAELGNAGLDQERFLRERIAICEECLRRWPGEDPLFLGNVKSEMAEALFNLGETERATSLYNEWLAKDPQWGWGWIRWSDLFRWGEDETVNLPEAERILKQGLAVADVRDRADMFESLADLYQEMGREEDAERARQEMKGLIASAPPTEPPGIESMLRISNSVEYEDEEFVEPEDDWIESDPEGIRKHGPKIGRNDPCPCGSGKKYKKCCGR
jgi:tetratricopeptide (TPR) repeat protein